MTAARTILVVDVPVRLYEAPEPGFALPWAAFDDLLRAAEFPPEIIGAWAWRWLSVYPDRSHTLPDGQLLVSSESARDLFEAARLSGWEPADRALVDLNNGSSNYFAALYHHLDGAAFCLALSEAVLRSATTGATH